MSWFSRTLLGLALAAPLFALSPPSRADDTIKIGEINSYSALPSFTEPYRKGWMLALDEINAAPLLSALRTGAPSLGWRIAAACSSSPFSPTAAALP